MYRIIYKGSYQKILTTNVLSMFLGNNYLKMLENFEPLYITFLFQVTPLGVSAALLYIITWQHAILRQMC